MADKGGLEGVVVARSRLCSIDGQNGVLIYGGYDVGELAEQSSYEEVCFLTLHGRLPTREELDAFAAELVSHRQLSDETASVVDMLAGHAAPMEMLRTAVSSDSFDDPDKDANDPDANRRKASRLIAKMPTMVARYARRREGLEPVAPVPGLGHAANFLNMLSGERPSASAAKTFDVALILHADHEMNASTFTARVIASTLSDMHSAITGAIGALKGPLHGAARPRGRSPRALHDVEPHRGGRAAREGPLPERRLLLRLDLPLPGHRDRPLHADLRHEPGGRLGRTRDRAASPEP